MRKISTLVLGLCVALAAQSQRYLSEVFTDVTVTSNVVYGRNATILPIIAGVSSEALPEDLKMDVYQPTGDTETNRPVILYFHTGNFLPFPLNGGTGGTKTDSTAVEICKRFARMGYVAISCDYRLGWNPLASTQAERTWFLINAAYRGVQDARTAVRYMRKSVAELGNPYNIDPEKIALWGQGTGGYISFAASTINDYVSDIASITKFTWSPQGTPQPMVISFVNGDIFGTSYGINPTNNDTLCYPNHVGYSSDVSACVNMGGAMGDISWLEPGSPPMISFHIPSDPFAPYQDGTVVVPTTQENVVDVSGSYTVQAQAYQYGNNTSFQLVESWAPGAPYTSGANLHNDGYYGLYPFVRPATQPFDSSPWDWWDTQFVSSVAPTNNSNGLLTNPDMSATKARTFIDTIQAYTAPRLMCALGLPDSPCQIEVPLNDVCLTAFDVQSLLGGAVNNPVTSDPYTNENATTVTDPTTGWDCFEDLTSSTTIGATIDNTVWFTFTGDGEAYTIHTSDCGGSATMVEGDTQMAIYSGDCNNLTPVACNEDIDFDNSIYWAGTTLATTAGTTYYMMIDGYHYYDLDGVDLGGAIGTFCLDVTKITINVDELAAVQLNVYPNPATNEFVIKADNNIQHYELYNTVGQIVLRSNGQRGSQILVNADLAPGVYNLSVTTDNGVATSKVVIK